MDCVLRNSTRLLDSYPNKLTLIISRKGNNAAPSSEWWDLDVFGLDRPKLSFKIAFPSQTNGMCSTQFRNSTNLVTLPPPLPQH